jgi:ribonuclease HI
MLKMLMPFGKHRGKNLNIVFKTDKRYIEWLVTTDWYNERFSDYAKKSKELLNDYDKNIVYSKNINIYTDGSCAFNGMKGATCGIGIYFCETNQNKINDVSELLLIDNPTNNYAELFAIDTALKIIIKKNLTDKHINLYTDSKYSIDCITKWYEGWVKNDKLDRPNIEVIQSIYDNVQRLNIDFHHVFAHTKKNDIHSIGNSRADSLATKCVYDYLNKKTFITHNEL